MPLIRTDTAELAALIDLALFAVGDRIARTVCSRECFPDVVMSIRMYREENMIPHTLSACPDLHGPCCMPCGEVASVYGSLIAEAKPS